MFNALKGNLIWGVLKFTIIFTLSFSIFVVGIFLLLLFTYGILADITSGTGVLEAVEYLLKLSPEGMLQELGKQVFTNIPFADFINSVFITHIKPDFVSLLSDVVTAAFAGLIFFLVARLNVFIGAIIKSRMIFNSIVSVMTVFSICAAMITTTWIDSKVDGVPLFFIQLGVFLLSCVLHTFLLFKALKITRLKMVTLHVSIDVVTGILNNVFLWFCSFLFMQCIPLTKFLFDIGFYRLFGFSEQVGSLAKMEYFYEMTTAFTVIGSFILYLIYSHIINSVAAYVWEYIGVGPREKQ